MSNEYQGSIVKAEEVNLGDKPEIQEDVAAAMSEVSADWDSLRKQEKDKFIQDHKVELQDDDITIFKRPRSGCKHCHGRGIVGFYAMNSKKLPGEPTLCRCITNMMSIRGEMPDAKDRMSYKEFRDMLAKARQVYNLKEPENEQDDQVADDSVQSDVQEVSEGRDQERAAESN